MQNEDVVINVLGGGIGGLVASSILKDKLGNRAIVRLFERKKHFEFPPSYPWLMLGMRQPEQVQKDMHVLSRKGIEIINDEVVSLDIVDQNKKEITTKNNGKFSSDFLVVALGAEYAPELIPGFQERAFHIYNLESALKFREAIEKFQGGTIAIGISRLPFKCPAAPYEVALLLDDYCRKKGMKEGVNFEFFTPETNPLPAVGPEIGSKVLEFLESRGINYHPKLKLSEVGEKELKFEGSDITIPYDLLFCVPPHKAPQVVTEAGLTDPTTGWISVNPETLETKSKGVYAVGDVASLPTPSGYVPYLPKAGVFAHGQAEVVANNITVQVRGKGKLRTWDGEGSCFLEVGQGKSAFVKGNFLASPRPDIKFHMPDRIWHMQKVLFEKYWMHHWF